MLDWNQLRRRHIRCCLTVITYKARGNSHLCGDVEEQVEKAVEHAQPAVQHWQRQLQHSLQHTHPITLAQREDSIGHGRLKILVDHEKQLRRGHSILWRQLQLAEQLRVQPDLTVQHLAAAVHSNLMLRGLLGCH